jgi:hypothetical protein
MGTSGSRERVGGCREREQWVWEARTGGRGERGGEQAWRAKEGMEGEGWRAKEGGCGGSEEVEVTVTCSLNITC